MAASKAEQIRRTLNDNYKDAFNAAFEAQFGVACETTANIFAGVYVSTVDGKALDPEQAAWGIAFSDGYCFAMLQTNQTFEAAKSTTVYGIKSRKEDVAALPPPVEPLSGSDMILLAERTEAMEPGQSHLLILDPTRLDDVDPADITEDMALAKGCPEVYLTFVRRLRNSGVEAIHATIDQVKSEYARLTGQDYLADLRNDPQAVAVRWRELAVASQT